MEKIKKQLESLKKEVEALSEIEKERVKSFIIDFFDFKAYDLIYAAQAKMNRVNINDIIPLKELVNIGFNYIKIYSDDGDLIYDGYEECDFDEETLNKKIEITNFYNDMDNYLCVEAKMIS